MTRTFREEVDLLIGRELRAGTPPLALANALVQHLREVLVVAVALDEATRKGTR